MRFNRIIDCVLVAAFVAFVLYALGAPAGAFAFVIVCPLMMIAITIVGVKLMQTHDDSREH